MTPEQEKDFLIKNIKIMLTESIKERDEVKKTAYRTVVAEINLAEIKEDLTTDRVLAIIRKERDKYLESAEAFKSINETISNLHKECSEVLANLLPRQISEDQYQSIFDEYKDLSFGEIMKKVKEEYGSFINMKSFSAFVKNINK